MKDKRTIDDVAETLLNARNHGRSTTLLVGAGCSVTAGIPTAAGFVDAVKKEYPQAYKRAREKTYPACMAQLSKGQRRDLIARYVDEARINWAHLGIAQLIKAGYVDRVLTTNFDSLVVRACGLVGLFPAVYDVGSSQLFNPGDIPETATFYLHGQRTGFVLMNTTEECRQHSKRLAPIFKDAGIGRSWLVVGYSGSNDPVFDHLAKVKQFDQRLYWVCYRHQQPEEHVRKSVISERKYAYVVPGFDADDFFVTLTQKLNCFPPDIIGNPVTYLETLADMVAPYTIPGDDEELDLKKHVRFSVLASVQKWIASQDDDNTAHSPTPSGTTQTGELPSPEFVEEMAWNHVMRGNALSDMADRTTGEESDRLFESAYVEYRRALEIKPDMKEAINNLANTLSDQARIKVGDESERLFHEAYKHYEAALALVPDDFGVLNNWGNALGNHADQKSGNERAELIRLSLEKLEAGLAIAPDSADLLYNLGNHRWDIARSMSGEEMDEMLNLAYESYSKAVELRPGWPECLTNWGNAMMHQAIRTEGNESDHLFEQAFNNYRNALETKPDFFNAISNWGAGLFEQARTKIGQAAEELYERAYEKFELALDLNPEASSTIRNWGNALWNHAKLKSGKEAQQFLALANEKYGQAMNMVATGIDLDRRNTFTLGGIDNPNQPEPQSSPSIIDHQTEPVAKKKRAAKHAPTKKRKSTKRVEMRSDGKSKKTKKKRSAKR